MPEALSLPSSFDSGEPDPTIHRFHAHGLLFRSGFLQVSAIFTQGSRCSTTICHPSGPHICCHLLHPPSPSSTSRIHHHQPPPIGSHPLIVGCSPSLPFPSPRAASNQNSILHGCPPPSHCRLPPSLSLSRLISSLCHPHLRSTTPCPMTLGPCHPTTAEPAPLLDRAAPLQHPWLSLLGHVSQSPSLLTAQRRQPPPPTIDPVTIGYQPPHMRRMTRRPPLPPRP